MRKELKFIGCALVAGLVTLGVANTPKPGSDGEVKLVFSSATHGYFDTCG